jgi:ubiquinone biosynthesis protein COQ4
VNLAQPTTPLTHRHSRWATALGAGLTLLRDPKRVDQVLLLADTVNVRAYRRIGARMKETACGRRLIDARAVWTKSSMHRLGSLPDGVLGREYQRFLADNALSPEGLSSPPRIDDPIAAYVARRLRQTHDVWHVLTGYEPDVRGEILLQAFTFAQVRSPSALLIVLFGLLRWMWFYKSLVVDVVTAYRRGKRAGFLAAIRWEDEWSTPLVALQKRLALVS